jgi:hypothetical protein
MQFTHEVTWERSIERSTACPEEPNNRKQPRPVTLSLSKECEQSTSHFDRLSMTMVLGL